MQLGGIEDVPAENSLVAFFPAGESEIELVQPTTRDSGLARYLEKRGPGMHHVCLEVDDIDGMLVRLKEQDIQLINETAVSGLHGRRYAFIHPKATGGVLVELYQLSQPHLILTIFACHVKFTAACHRLACRQSC